MSSARGLCERCEEEAAEFECSSCGRARLSESQSDPLALCVECSSILHAKGIFRRHKLVNISRKLWLPVEEKLELLKERETSLKEAQTKSRDTVTSVNTCYDQSVRHVEEMMKELREDINEREKVLIAGLGQIRDQRTQQCDHVSTQCNNLIDQLAEVMSKAQTSLTVEARQFAEERDSLLDQMSQVLDQSVAMTLPATDCMFSLANSVAIAKRRISDILVLPLPAKQVQPGETVSGMVVSKMTPHGLFWVRLGGRNSEGILSVISHSIKVDIDHNVIQPITDPKAGQFCCACYSEDHHWHRAQLTNVVSSSYVKICYIDYGNYQDCTVSQLRSLPDKYLYYPLQTIRCCLSEEQGVELSREARWLFNDRTKNKVVYLHIISELPPANGDTHTRYLVSVQEQEGGGDDISNLVLSKMKEEQKQSRHPIIHRDYRLNQPNPPRVATPTSQEAPPPSKATSALNMDAPEFVLSQPGVLHIPHSAFQTLTTSMTGVNVTTNVPSSLAGVEDCITSTPVRVGNNVTDVNDRERINSTPTGVRNNVTDTRDRDSVTPTGIGNDVTSTHTEMGDDVVPANNVIESSVTIIPTGVGSENVTSVGNIVSKDQNNEASALQEVTSSTDNCIDNIEVTSGHQLENVSTSQDESTHDLLVGVAYDVDGTAPPLLEALVPGVETDITIVTDLKPDGTFWSQREVDDKTDEIFAELMDSLQSLCAELKSNHQSTWGTPQVGSLCAALYSVDNDWYRGRVEELVTSDQFLVRYLDYGNAEVVTVTDIVPLVENMRELPFQAFCCSIASDDHTSFTPVMCDRFAAIRRSRKDEFQAKILSISSGSIVEVELTVEHNGSVMNVNDDICLSDFVSSESLEFTRSSSQQLTWSEQMDDLGSPDTPPSDGVFTLPSSIQRSSTSREQSKSSSKSKSSHKASPATLRKVSSHSKRQLLRRQHSGEKPKKQRSSQNKVTNEDSGILLSTEDWEEIEPSGGGGGLGGDSQMLLIKGFSSTTSREEVRQLLEQHGVVKEIVIEHGRVWATMNKAGAKMVEQKLTKHIIPGGDSRGLLIQQTTPDKWKLRYKGHTKY